MLDLIRDLVPKSVQRYRVTRRDNASFAALRPIPCGVQTLARLDAVDIHAVFHDPALDAEWKRVESQIAPLQVTDKAAGVNPGDRRALYYLIRHLAPSSVLEVGTNVGASTVHIAMAQRDSANGQPFELISVDIVDMNDAVKRPWSRLGALHSPAEAVRRLGFADAVQFRVGDSLAYLRQCQRKFDAIFLDGSHDATQVYQEVPAATGLLNEGGHILLHDYFPQQKPLWSNGTVEAGPWRAIQRLRSEGASLDVLPFGALPWPTKLDSNVTSLALLGRV